MGGSTGSSGPTLQQQQLQTEQAQTNANLNLEENSQRKTILNAMQGTRVYRGSALARAVAGNNDDPGTPAPAPSNSQTNSYGQLISPSVTASLLDDRAGGSGATAAGGAGASGGTGGGVARAGGGGSGNTKGGSAR